MAPGQPFLWVSVGSQGKTGNSERQTSDIKSHCAQYYHQVNRQNLRIRLDDLSVPQTATIAPKVPPTKSLHGRRDPSSNVSGVEAGVDSDAQQRVKEQFRGKKSKPTEWRKLRCNRFRQQSIKSNPKSDLLTISPEVLGQLPIEMDSNAYDMLKFLYSVWLPCLFPEKHSAVNRRNGYLDAVLSDPLTLSVNMTSLFSRAAFLSPAPTGTSSPTDDHSSPIRRTLYLYKLSAIAIIRQRLSESAHYLDQNVFLGIVTLAGCEFMANNALEGRLHLEACLEIAHARGGLTTLSDLELELMCLAEFDIAALSGELPCAPLLEMEVAVYSKISKPTNDSLWINSGFAPLECLTADRVSPLQKGLACLLETTIGINQSASLQSTPPHRENLVLRGLFAGFQLCSVQKPSADLCHYIEGDLDICEPLRLAGLLIVATTCLKNTPKTHLYDTLTGEIALHLQQLPRSFCLHPSVVPAMLWICFIGAYGTSTSPKQAFFLQGIAHMGILLDLEHWSDIRMQLRLFPYIDKEFDIPFEEIWSSARFWAKSTP